MFIIGIITEKITTPNIIQALLLLNLYLASLRLIAERIWWDFHAFSVLFINQCAFLGHFSTTQFRVSENKLFFSRV